MGGGIPPHPLFSYAVHRRRSRIHLPKGPGDSVPVLFPLGTYSITPNGLESRVISKKMTRLNHGFPRREESHLRSGLPRPPILPFGMASRPLAVCMSAFRLVLVKTVGGFSPPVSGVFGFSRWPMLRASNPRINVACTQNSLVSQSPSVSGWLLQTFLTMAPSVGFPFGSGVTGFYHARST